jgi:hypothetical protein
MLMASAPTITLAKQVSVALGLTLDRAIAELRWKMDKSPEFDDSGSLTRVLDDLMAAREGWALYMRQKKTKR